MLSTFHRSAFAAPMVLSLVVVCTAQPSEPATLIPQQDAGREVTTEELQVLLVTSGATILDARPYREYAISHIPGAVNVAPKPGVPMSMYVSDVAEIGRLLNGNKAAPLVVYCNGPYCGKSSRLAAELHDAGYSNVRRYQLGIPTWRAAGGVCAIELDGIRHIVANDGTAVVLDSREPSEFHRATVRGAKNIPRSLVLEGKDVGEVKRAKDDGRLPMEDHNTRIVVLGTDAASARYVAEALAREAFHNVSFFTGPFATVHKALTQQEARPEVFQRTVSPRLRTWIDHSERQDQP
jgi:rhodanese-related sulfurtransferase